MAMADPPAEDPAPTTPTWHAVINNATDRRILDWDFGHTAQAHLTATMTANSGSSIITIQGEPPSQIAIGDYINPGGDAVAPPAEAQMNDNELLENRKAKIENWIVRNGPTRQFLFYQSNVSKLRADVFGALLAAAFYRTRNASTLTGSNWTRLNALTALEWDSFCTRANLTLWAPEGDMQYDLINNLKNGTTWRDVSIVGGLYVPVTLQDAHNWPAAYVFNESHRNDYIELIKTVQVL